jgi:hypothetical protein
MARWTAAMRKQRPLPNRFGERVKSTSVTARKADTRAATAGKIFSNVDPNVEGTENVSFSLKHQLPV